MKIPFLREELIRTGQIAGAVVAVALVIMGYSFYDRQTREDELAQVQRDLALSKNQITKLEDDNNEFIQMQLKYNHIPDRQRDANLSDLASRTALLQTTLQNLKVRYRLGVLDISLTNVAPFLGAQDDKVYATHFNTVTLKFGGLSDELLISFLQELFETLPGYFRVSKLELKRQKNISSEILSQIQGSSIPVLVDGGVIFSWKTVRKK